MLYVPNGSLICRRQRRRAQLVVTGSRWCVTGRLPAQVMTPAQTSWLDCQCHPWTPHLWTLAGLLAERHPGEPSRAAEAQLLAAGTGSANSCEGDKAQEVALTMGAFGLLRTPLLGRGAGLALRREHGLPRLTLHDTIAGSFM